MDDGFALPAVEDEVGNLSTLQPLHQDIARGNRATAGIDKQGTRTHRERKPHRPSRPWHTSRTCQRTCSVMMSLSCRMSPARQSLQPPRARHEEGRRARGVSLRHLHAAPVGHLHSPPRQCQSSSPAGRRHAPATSAPAKRGRTAPHPQHYTQEHSPSQYQQSDSSRCRCGQSRRLPWQRTPRRSPLEVSIGVHDTADEQRACATDMLGGELPMSVATHFGDLLHQPLEIGQGGVQHKERLIHHVIRIKKLSRPPP